MSSVIRNDIGVVIATILPCFSKLEVFFPQSLIEDCLSNTKYKIYDSVFEII